MSSPSSHRWKFFRTGGLDQVALETAADLANLRTLDQKLWVALSCPVNGLALDPKTLTLIDHDKDGRIKVPEVLDAIDWTATRLKSLDVLLKPSPTLPLAAINDQTPEGKSLLAAAKQILLNLGKDESAALSPEDTSDSQKIFANTRFNGDGVLPADVWEESAVRQLIADVIACEGSVPDRSGRPGITQAQLDKFFADLEAWHTWYRKGASRDILIAGPGTGVAYEAVTAVRAKIDDYFARCRLAAFDSRALAAVNRQESEYLALAAKDLRITDAEIAAFPLARIAPNQPLPLDERLNPAWVAAIARLQTTAITPILGPGKTVLTSEEWALLTDALAPYEGWWKAKPVGNVEKLGPARIEEILRSPTKAAVTHLLAEDLALKPQSDAIDEVDQLVRYHRDLGTLLRNFVNFADFYDPRVPATFQVGTLYLDSRSCDLCIRVEDPAAHSILASLSKIYIAYCDLKRAGGTTMKIAACFTQGDSDYLMVGRNGLFYDRDGRSWHATITKILDNPISIRQAFWSPYKKFVRMVEEQIAKRAAAAQTRADATLGTVAASVAQADKSKPAEPKRLDVGTVAAIGVAVGSIGTMIAAIFTKAVELSWWQYPLVVLGIVLAISGPSVLIAWLKLRQRTLGPVLDANGWAVNGRVKINIPFGTELTGRAQLPPGSRHPLTDPFAERSSLTRNLLLATLVLLAIAFGVRWDQQRRGHYFWQSTPPAPPPAAPAPTTPPTPTTAPLPTAATPAP